MSNFRETLREQRWDDHRYYHHSLVNQSLHLVSATSFICAYLLVFWAPWMAAIIGCEAAQGARAISRTLANKR